MTQPTRPRLKSRSYLVSSSDSRSELVGHCCASYSKHAAYFSMPTRAPFASVCLVRLRSAARGSKGRVPVSLAHAPCCTACGTNARCRVRRHQRRPQRPAPLRLQTPGKACHHGAPPWTTASGPHHPAGPGLKPPMAMLRSLCECLCADVSRVGLPNELRHCVCRRPVLSLSLSPLTGHSWPSSKHASPLLLWRTAHYRWGVCR